jgi:predicted transcriptional regulator YdeE
MTHTPRFEDGRPMLLAGLRRHHGFAESVSSIPAQWDEFEQLGEIPGRVGAVAYGAMCGADPERQTLEYLVGVEVESFDGLPAHLGRMRVPAVRYAVFTHEGPIESIRATWNAAMNEWLPKSGFKSANTPDFERYDERFDAETGSGIVEIWLGIVPAG